MKIALTGAMGSGKSTVRLIFKKYLTEVYSADDYCKSLLDNDVLVKKEVEALLGSSVFDINGKADKAKIASLVFANTDLLKGYEAIFHRRFEAFLDTYVPKNNIVLYEIPLLFEKKLEKV